MVAYVLDITGIGIQLKNDLLFERFLNEERYSMPDIDIDLPDIYRGEFLHYVRDRYGSKALCTDCYLFNFGAKQAIRDVLNVLELRNLNYPNSVKNIFRDTLTTVYEKNMSFRQLINQRQEFQRALKLLRLLKASQDKPPYMLQVSWMSDDDLTNHIPLKAGEDMMVTQYDASAVEANGLLKMDFWVSGI